MLNDIKLMYSKRRMGLALNDFGTWQEVHNSNGVGDV